MGGGQQDGYPSHAPLPPVGRILPKIGGIAISHHVTGLRVTPSVREWSAKCPRVVLQGVTWPVWRGVRKRDFFIYSSIKGYFKKPFYKTGVRKPSSTLLQCQSLPTSFLRAVRSEYPANIVFALSRGGRLFFLSRLRYILQATSLQKAVNNKNKAGHNSTRGTVSSLLFPAKKYCCTQSTYSTSLCALRLKIEDLHSKRSLLLVMFMLTS